jgi:WD40 repeat protein
LLAAGALAGVASRAAAEELRGFAPERRIKLLDHDKGEPAVVVGVAIASGGRLVAAAGDDHQIGLFDPKTGQLVRHLHGHTDWVRTVAFAPDAVTMASAGNDRQVRLWNSDKGTQLLMLPRHAQAIAALAFHPAGNLLATLGFDNQLKLYDPARGELVRELSCSSADNRALAFSPDGKRLAAAGRDGLVRVWNTADWSVERTLAGHRRRVRALSFSPNSELLGSAGEDRNILVWKVESGEQTCSIPLPTAKAFSLVFVRDHLLACGGSDNTVRLFDVLRREAAHRLDGHTGSVAALAYDAVSGTLVSGSYDTTIGIWNLSQLEDNKTTLAPGTTRTK